MILACVNANTLSIDRETTMHLYNVLAKYHPKCCVHTGQTGKFDLNWEVWRTYIKRIKPGFSLVLEHKG